MTTADAADRVHSKGSKALHQHSIMMRSCLLVACILAVCHGFQTPSSTGGSRLAPLQMGVWDKFKDSMEGNYAGEDSAYAKIKAADAAKAQASKAKMDARKKKVSPAGIGSNHMSLDPADLVIDISSSRASPSSMMCSARTRHSSS